MSRPVSKKASGIGRAKPKPGASERNRKWVCCAPLPLTGAAAARKVIAGGKAAVLNGNRWQAGSTIEIRFLGGSAKLRRRVQKSAQKWLRSAGGPANLFFSFFDPSSENPGDIRISFEMDGTSWSMIGTDARVAGPQEATMNFGWLTDTTGQADLDSVVLHEFGHAIGCIHEHQNPEKPIRWDRRAVIASLSGPPNNWDLATIQSNMFDRYKPRDLTKTPVDPKSIMMYQIPPEWTHGTFTAGYNTKLSPNDFALLSKVYP